MLGHMVRQYLSDKNDFSVSTTNSKWPSDDFKKEIISFSSQSNVYVVNCIGAIPQKVDVFDINSDLPIWLENNISNYKCKIVHPGTDCEIDNDKYGISKRKATDYIIKHGEMTKIIKTSIIGPELSTKDSLLEWFLNCQNTEIDGYTHVFWNGITTLQWANVCNNLIKNWDYYNTVTTPSTECISKYDLLKKIKNIFKKQIIIKKDSKIKVNKCLKGNLEVPSIDNQLIELKKFMQDNS